MNTTKMPDIQSYISAEWPEQHREEVRILVEHIYDVLCNQPLLLAEDTAKLLVRAVNDALKQKTEWYEDMVGGSRTT
jgi:hypothetical protein